MKTNSKKKPRIMFYINVLGGGGAERVMCNLANDFSTRNYEVYLVASFPVKKEYTLSEKIYKLYLEDSERQTTFIRRNLGRVWKLRKLCKKIKPDILCGFMAEPNFRVLAATIGTRIKTIISVRNDPNREYAGKLNRYLAKTLFLRADGCVFQTKEAKEWFPEELQRKSTIIMNQVAEQFFLECSSEKNIDALVSVGRLSKQKNHHMLIEAFAMVAGKFPDVCLKIYGDGPLKEELNEYISEIGLDHRVMLEGSVKDVPSVLSNCKGFILSSDYEGMPNTLLEAMAMGCPSISTDCPCGGSRAIIQDGKNGLLVPIKNAECMAEAICNILSNPEFAYMLGKNAKKTALGFHPQNIFSKWEKYIYEVWEK